jgi:hypothetical protein
VSFLGLQARQIFVPRVGHRDHGRGFLLLEGDVEPAAVGPLDEQVGEPERDRHVVRVELIPDVIRRLQPPHEGVHDLDAVAHRTDRAEVVREIDPSDEAEEAPIPFGLAIQRGDADHFVVTAER